MVTSGALAYDADGETMIGRLALPAGDNARHRFTDPEAASAGNPALAYNALAAERAWHAMLDHLRDSFA